MATAGYKERLLDAQASRLAQVNEFLGMQEEPLSGDAMDRTICSLGMLVKRLYDERDDRDLWLAFIGMSGAYPSQVDMEKAIQFRDANGRDAFFDWFIAASAVPATWGGASSRLRFITDLTLVDVNGCARFDRHTGIQRVERETLPLWVRDHALELVAWTDRDSGYRALGDLERARVVDFGHARGREDAPPPPGLDDELIVPWATTIVLPEVANIRQASRLEALARYSRNRLSVVAYDVIPFSSPELLPRDAGTDFLDYLGVVKYATVVAGISRSATEEFRGYFTAVGDGRTRLVTCELPSDVPATEAEIEKPASSDALVLCVGSHEPRKNHGAVLHAAERLWREGQRFRLVFLGGGGWGTDFDVQAAHLRKAGRPIELRKGVSDRVLWQAYREARFTVFPSLHEGYGLPVAESLALGTPVITTNYGSTKEIGERGGCLLIDPRDDSALHDAMQRLLTDDDLLETLSSDARSIELRSWDDYARDLWRALVDDVG